MKSSFFLDVTPYNLVEVFRCSGRTHYLQACSKLYLSVCCMSVAFIFGLLFNPEGCVSVFLRNFGRIIVSYKQRRSYLSILSIRKNFGNIL
jgi:hypothetical protein